MGVSNVIFEILRGGKMRVFKVNTLDVYVKIHSFVLWDLISAFSITHDKNNTFRRINDYLKNNIDVSFSD